MWCAITGFPLAVTSLLLYCCALRGESAAVIPLATKDFSGSLMDIQEMKPSLGTANEDNKKGPVKYAVASVRNKRNFEYLDYYGGSSEEGSLRRRRNQASIDHYDEDQFNSAFPSRPLFVSDGNVVREVLPLHLSEETNKETRNRENENLLVMQNNSNFEIIPSVMSYEHHSQFEMPQEMYSQSKSVENFEMSPQENTQMESNAQNYENHRTKVDNELYMLATPDYVNRKFKNNNNEYFEMNIPNYGNQQIKNSSGYAQTRNISKDNPMYPQNKDLNFESYRQTGRTGNIEGRRSHYRRRNRYRFDRFTRTRNPYSYNFHSVPFYGYYPSPQPYWWYFSRPNFPTEHRNDHDDYRYDGFEQNGPNQNEDIASTTEAIPNISYDIDVRVNH